MSMAAEEKRTGKGIDGREREGKGRDGHQAGYYEIAMNGRYLSQMPAAALAGNVIYNRMHWHEHLEVMCCLKGSFSLRAGGEILRLSEGDFAAINPEVPHEIFDGREDGLQIIYSVDARFLRKKDTERYQFATVGDNALPADCPEAKAFRKSVGRIAWITTPERDVLEAHIRKWEKSEDLSGQEIFFPREEDWYAYQREVYESLWCLARHKSDQEREAERREGQEQFYRCVQMIHRQYGARMDAGSLGAALGLSEPTIYRMFRKYLGMSLNSYIRLVRLRSAQNLLEGTDREITEIAYTCGFGSLSNFYRVFQDLTGQSPGEYRRQRRPPTPERVGMQKDVMGMNRFQSFFELPYTRDDLLAFGSCQAKCREQNV